MNPEIEQYMNDYVSDLMATREALLESLKYALRDDPKFEDAEVLEEAGRMEDAADVRHARVTLGFVSE